MTCLIMDVQNYCRFFDAKQSSKFDELELLSITARSNAVLEIKISRKASDKTSVRQRPVAFHSFLRFI